MLTNGTELKGLLKYNTRNGILAFQDGIESRVLTPIRVAGFEFFDESLSRQRIFYTFKYKDAQTDVDRPLFFELLRDFKTFAILSKVDQVDVDLKRDSFGQRLTAKPFQFDNTSAYPNNASSRLEVSQTETIYLMNSEGIIKPYIKAIVIQDGVTDIFTKKDSKTKNKMIDRDLIEEYVSPEHYEKLLKYSEHYTLNFKVKSDSMKILDYYEKLITN